MLTYKGNIERGTEDGSMTDSERTDAKELYYKNKLRLESVMKIVDGMRTTQEAKEATKTEYKISAEERESLGKTIEKYQNYNATGDEEQDKIAGLNLLKKFEDTARLAVERYRKSHRAEPEDDKLKV